MSDLAWLILSLLAFVPAIVCHECAHGFVANRLGDPTAKRSGRLSLNPLKHIDPFGTVLLPIILALSHMPVFGYAKPVPYNPRYFKDLRKGELLTGIAGPCMNIILAFVGVGIAWAGGSLFVYQGVSFAYWIFYFGYIFTMVNFTLAFFNIIPIPPLDGASIIGFFLPEKAMPVYYKIQQYALPVFFIIVIVLPYIFHVDPIGWFLDVTAVKLTQLLVPFI